MANDRDEEGFFYGVNLEGKHLLMLCARLGGKNKPISALQREEISVPDAILAGTSEVLFTLIPLLQISLSQWQSQIETLTININVHKCII